jgi:hypothetical protein
MRALPLLLTFLAGLASTPAAAAVLFVDVNGTDADPGSVARPLQSIGRALERALPGDLIVVRPGTYRESVTIARSGEPRRPLVIRGLPGAVLVSPDPGASLSAFDVREGVGFVTIQGFEMTGGFAESVFVRPGAHDVELAGLHVHHNRTGIWIAGAANVVVRDTLVERNYRTGIRIFAGAHDVTVRDTRAVGNDDGLGCDGDSDGFSTDASTSDVTFERASAAGNSEDGFDLRGSGLALLQVTAQENGCSGVKLGGAAYLENVLVARSRTGINLHLPPDAAAVLQNCTLSRNDLGLRAAGGGYMVVLRDSIISGPWKALSFAAAVQLIEARNILYRPAPNERLIVRINGDAERWYSGTDVNRGGWQRESAQGAGTFYADPGLEEGSCRPRRDSSAVDTGGAAGAAPVDLSGVTRPVGNAVDRGAFEWAPSTITMRAPRLRLHTRSDGTGSVALQADIVIRGDTRLDLSALPLGVTLRGARGDVMRVEVAAGAWKRSAARQGTLLRATRVDDNGRRVRVTLHAYADRVTLAVRARAADVWALDASGAMLTVELGTRQASSGVGTRVSGRTWVLVKRTRCA